MQKYLKKIARSILSEELWGLELKIADAKQDSENLLDENKKLQKKIKKLENPENILLQYYRIDNIGVNGMPPSYLKPEDPNEYTQRISELESIYRNTAFREMMAWALNFHANLSVVGKMRNDMGDEIDIPTDHARHMISGIKAIWELVVAAHNKDRELTSKKSFDPYELMDTDDAI